MGSVSGITGKDDRVIFFFDIDNCLYKKSKNVHDHMARLINDYFTKHFSEMTSEQATQLHLQYYKDYGLAIEGLARHHQVDPLDFNREVDDALPLDDLLSPDAEVREILESFDKTRVKMWLFTNAHITHGKRVVRIMEIDDLFEGITYCDYAESPLVPKPLPAMYEKAEREAGVTDHTKIYFVDDSFLNCRDAYARGWSNTVHLVEPQVPDPTEKACKYQTLEIWYDPGKRLDDVSKSKAVVLICSGAHNIFLEYADVFDEVCVAFDTFDHGAKLIEQCIVFRPAQVSLNRAVLMKAKGNLLVEHQEVGSFLGARPKAEAVVV